MKKVLSILTIVILLGTMLFVLTGCGAKEETAKNGDSSSSSSKSGNNNSSGDIIADSFKQFGVDLEKVKPNMGTPNKTSNEYGSEVSDTVYYKKAAYIEKVDTEIDKTVGKEYNEKMFNYIKSISADGKCYTSKTGSDGAPTEITSVDELIDESALINMISWGYKYDGMWVDVYMEWSMIGSEIGITLQGAGSY